MAADSISNADPPAEQHNENGDAQPDESIYTLKVKLPNEPFETQIQVSTQEQVQDIRQSIADQPFAMQYSCFHLEHNGERINDFVELSEVPGVKPDSVLSLIEDPYTEKEARMHVVRIRELIGASGDRTDTIHGVSAGASIHDFITDGETITNGHALPIISTKLPDIADYQFADSAPLNTLISPTLPAAPKTVKSISVSPWNPPPYHLRTQGHLMYLIVTTNENEQLHITSHVSGFYVSKSSMSKFDPSPKPLKNGKAHSLLNLLKAVSPSFESSFKALLEYNCQRDPLALFQLSNAIPASPWLVPPPTSSSQEHQYDITRTQESYLLSGQELAETLRDWNEEFQSTRELPKETVQDKVFRERLTNKLFADYNEAAVRGAVLVARGEVPPLNPTEGRDAQIFVYNNIFYSFGADGVGTFVTEGGDEAARVATGKDVMGVKAVNQLDITGLFTPGTVVVDYLGKRIVGQSIVPGIFKQREPGEHQIDYGGVEGKDVVAENEAFVPLFEKLSTILHVKEHAVWDKEKKRHDLKGSVETKGLLGTDGRKYVLDLYRITPLDVAWLEQHWIAESEGKTDGVKSYPHRMSVLRPELIEAYARTKLRGFVDAELAKAEAAVKETKAIAEKGDDDKKTLPVDGEEKNDDESKPEMPKIDISKFRFALNPDVFSGQVPQTDEEKEQYEKDEQEVRTVCSYLAETVMPRLIRDLEEGDVSFPMDGESLTILLHRRGVNMRYLGSVHKLAGAKETPRLQALQRLVVQEMAARGFKHVANRYLKNLPAVFAPACFAHLLNCLLGKARNASPSPASDENLKSIYPDSDFGFEKISPETIRQEIIDEIALRFRFNVEGDIVEAGREVHMLREIALRMGLQLAAKEYIFTAGSPASTTNGINGDHAPSTDGNQSTASKKGKKKGKDTASPPRATSPAPTQVNVTFQAQDIINFVPKVKDASPKSVLAEEAFEGGRLSIAQGNKELGQELLLESLSLYEQIYGILHPEVARTYLQLSTLYYSLEEKAAAVDLARKAVIVAERTLGIDHNETVTAYLNLALFEHANNNSKLAVCYVLHALQLWKIVYGPHHPDSITTINNAAVMLQSMKQYHVSRIWFEACLDIAEQVSGKNTVNTATLLFQLAQALALDQESKQAVKRMQESCNIFRSVLGPEDKNTKEAEQWLQNLTQSAVNLAKRAKDMQSGKLKRVHFTTKMPGTGAQPAAATAAVDGSSSASASDRAMANIDKRDINQLVKFIDGDGGKKSPRKKSTNPKKRGGKA